MVVNGDAYNCNYNSGASFGKQVLNTGKNNQNTKVGQDSQQISLQQVVSDFANGKTSVIELLKKINE